MNPRNNNLRKFNIRAISDLSQISRAKGDSEILAPAVAPQLSDTVRAVIERALQSSWAAQVFQWSLAGP